MPVPISCMPWARLAKNNTISPIPAPPSNRIMSYWHSRTPNNDFTFSARSVVRTELSDKPEPAGSKSKPLFVRKTTSSKVRVLLKMSWIVNFGSNPMIISRFANPKSASTTRIRCPFKERAAARFAVMTVFPTPPLPLMMAIRRAFLFSSSIMISLKLQIHQSRTFLMRNHRFLNGWMT